MSKLNKSNLPTRKEIGDYVRDGLFTDTEWSTFLDNNIAKDGWLIGFEAIKKVKEKFELTGEILSPEIENYYISRIENETKEAKTINLLRQRVKTSLVLMFTALKGIQSSNK